MAARKKSVPKEIRLGAMNPPLTKQFAGLGIAPKILQNWQDFNQAISLLGIHDYLNRSQAEKCRNRLIRTIQAHLRKSGLVPAEKRQKPEKTEAMA